MYQFEFWKTMRWALDRGKKAHADKNLRSYACDNEFYEAVLKIEFPLRIRIIKQWEKGYDLAHALELCVY